MICDSCIHKEVCYEKEEDRRALKQCSDYFNFEEELEKLKSEIKLMDFDFGDYYDHTDTIIKMVSNVIEKRIEELKGENE